MLAFDDGLAFAGIAATILVAAAALTRFRGDWRNVADRARSSLVAVLTVSSLGLAAISSLTVPAVSTDPEVIPRAIIVFVCGWLISFVSFTIVEVATPEQAVARSQEELLRRMAQARRTVPRGDRVDAKTVRRAESALWIVPIALWVAVAVLPASLQFVNTPYAGYVVTIAASLLLLQLLVLLGWRSTADRSAGRAWRRLFRGVTAVPALAGAVAVAVASAGSSLGWLGWLNLSFCVVLTALFVERIAQRVPWLRRVRYAATARGLQRAHAWYARARLELTQSHSR